MPTEDNVEAIFDAIIPLLPTPHNITFDLQLTIAETALLNDEEIDLFNFCKA